ncbi:MAG: serine hydrolase domain-containing protein [Ginsengibacter sp.]
MKRLASLIHAIVIIGLCILPSFIIAQVIEKNGKPNPAIDYTRLARIDNLVNDYIKKDWVKSVVTIVIKDNQLVQYKGYGFADAETKKPMPNDAIFRIMSQTKAITSTGILILYEEGKLMLDEPIADFIPEFSHPVVLDKYHASDTTYTTVPAKREITFRDLLTHTSGLDYADIGTDNFNAIYAKAGVPSGLGYFDAGLLDKMKLLAKQPLAFQPGEKWQYGLNSDLLGCLIEVISGQSLEDYFREKIFEPLGMNDSYFNVPASKAARMATVYTEDAEHHIILWDHHFRHIDPDYATMNKHYFSGGAGLSSTAWDYAVFLQMMLNKGTYNGHKILSPRTVELMRSGQIEGLYSPNDFGLGFEIVTPKGAALDSKNVGSFGWGGYFGTTYWADPKENLVCLIMTQLNPNTHDDLTKKIETLLYASLKN